MAQMDSIHCDRRACIYQQRSRVIATDPEDSSEGIALPTEEKMLLERRAPVNVAAEVCKLLLDSCAEGDKCICELVDSR